MDFEKIFKEGAEAEIEEIIKTIPINWEQHSRGVFNLIKYFEPSFKMSEQQKKLLKELLLYFTGNSDFNGSLSKGILLTGSVGSGKTLFLEKVFKTYTSEQLQNNSYIPFNFKDLAENYKTEGDKAFNPIKANKHESLNRMVVSPVLIDDLGAGDYILGNFGNKINLIDKVIDVRYLVFSRFRKLTHATTNLYVSDFKKAVDERTVSRMAEMFNIIELQDSDFRKIKL
jgi:predicted ATPase